MQKWEYAVLLFADRGDGAWKIYRPAGDDITERVRIAKDPDYRRKEFEVVIATKGLEGWELTATQENYYYFKRPIEETVTPPDDTAGAGQIGESDAGEK